MISFDVKSLFTNMYLMRRPLMLYLTRLMMKRKLKQTFMKDLLYLCTKHVHFTYGRNIYIRTDGVSMGSPLGPLLANIFMISLEEAILSSIKKHVGHWKRYVDDTHAYIDPSKIEFVLEKMNSYHPNI